MSYTLIVLYFSGALGSQTAALTNVTGFDSLKKCQEAGQEIKLLSDIPKAVNFKCIQVFK